MLHTSNLLQGNIKHLICADIAAVSMEECKERYEINKRRARGPLFSAEFIVADCTKVSYEIFQYVI